MERPLTPLTSVGLQRAAAELSAIDSRLGALVAANGVPPAWDRPEGFQTLIRIVLEQQVSLSSAAAAFHNLESALGNVTPEALLMLGDVQLREIGFSRQKAEYCRGISQAVVDGALDLDGLGSIDDDSVRGRLTSMRGVGPWTAEVYLLFALRRADVWPTGDRALVVSMAESLPLPDVPGYDEAGEIAESWRPWRSVAARILWHSYLLRRGRAPVLS